jgi:hypothetical protein
MLNHNWSAGARPNVGLNALIILNLLNYVIFLTFFSISKFWTEC